MNNKIYESIDELIGRTPILRLKSLEKKHVLDCRIYAKLEFFNPSGSSKDRAALQMILEAEKRGEIATGSTIIEPTSGNTGIALAAIAAARGYRAVIVMPENMSRERRRLISSYGARVVLTEAYKGMKGAVARANELHDAIPDSFMPMQFDNEANTHAHFLTTGPEIYEALGGKTDIFIAAVGTGGTLSGVGEYLKQRNSAAKVIAVEPEESALLSRGEAHPHKIQGIGAGFIPSILKTEIYDEVVTVSADDAYQAVHEAAETLGIGIGISSGAALAAMLAVAKRKGSKGKNIVTVFPDGSDRYLSTDLFE